MRTVRVTGWGLMFGMSAYVIAMIRTRVGTHVHRLVIDTAVAIMRCGLRVAGGLFGGIVSW